MSGTTFTLHPTLAGDTQWITDLPLCTCLLMRDVRYPWLILVPRLVGLREFHDLPAEHGQQLLTEITAASTTLQTLCNAHKINVAALGNQVEQLHIHVIARQREDAAWPGPVWGVGSATAYSDTALQTTVAAVRAALADVTQAAPSGTVSD